jgi:replication-associated recombination protein RarA
MKNNTKEKRLSKKQQAYYDNRVALFKSIHVAVPTGAIYTKALLMTDKECEEFLAIANA